MTDHRIAHAVALGLLLGLLIVVMRIGAGL